LRANPLPTDKIMFDRRARFFGGVLRQACMTLKIGNYGSEATPDIQRKAIAALTTCAAGAQRLAGHSSIKKKVRALKHLLTQRSDVDAEAPKECKHY